MLLFRRTILSPLHCRVTFVTTQVTVYACTCQFLDSLFCSTGFIFQLSEPKTLLQSYSMQINNKI